MNYLETKEGQESLEEALKLITQALRLLPIKLDKFGNFLCEKISEDRNVHGLKDPIIIESDSVKINYNEDKIFFLVVEYIGLNLAKTKNYDLEQESRQSDQ